jgi:hypothetical protein
LPALRSALSKSQLLQTIACRVFAKTCRCTSALSIIAKHILGAGMGYAKRRSQ